MLLEIEQNSCMLSDIVEHVLNRTNSVSSVTENGSGGGGDGGGGGGGDATTLTLQEKDQNKRMKLRMKEIKKKGKYFF